MKTSHIGRYAPSPTGPLHRGSLLAALAAFLQARAHGAPWYMRIDDLDTPRVLPGMATRILRTLEHFGLCWDGAVMYQSQRRAAHEQALRRLRAQGRVFDCGCTRRQARAGPMGLEGPVYPGTCRHGMPAGCTPRSVRMRVDNACVSLTDTVQGHYSQDLAHDVGDFVLRRADGIIAYQLATVVDDAAQGVTEVVRGADLLSSTPRQILLHRALEQARPAYVHVPLWVDDEGRKLGKSQSALPLDEQARGAELTRVLALLGQAPPAGLADETVDSIIAWAIAHWDVTKVATRHALTAGAGCGA